MGAMLWAFSPLDTFFFRDGTPYNAGEGSAVGIASAFPPYMTTLQGALRTALALGQGWMPPEREGWPLELGTPDDLGDLYLAGPYLRQGRQYLFPLPLFVAEQAGASGYCRLVPGEKVQTDLGLVHLPTFAQAVEGAKVLENAWVTRSGLEKILAGGVPQAEDVYCREADGDDNREQPWQREPRVGIARDPYKRTAIEGQLYAIDHVRPAADLEVVVRLKGIPSEWHLTAPAIIPLGGEGRMARIVKEDDASIVPPMGKLANNGDELRFSATLITPVLCRDKKEAENIIKGGPPGVPGRCISACLGRLGQLGGWDLVRHRPRPLRPLIPAGSTWFYSADPADFTELEKVHGQCDDPLGFGQIIIGSWEEKK